MISKVGVACVTEDGEDSALLLNKRISVDTVPRIITGGESAN